MKDEARSKTASEWGAGELVTVSCYNKLKTRIKPITMKKHKIYYWVFTILLALLMLMSAIPGIMGNSSSVGLVVTHMGYPLYFLYVVSWAKILGIVVLLVPGYPRLKEWAYAGFTIDLVGAIISFIAMGDPISQWALLFIWIVFIFLSYIFYHKMLRAKRTMVPGGAVLSA